MILKNNYGLSLLETMISISILTLVVLGTATLEAKTNRSLRFIDRKFQREQDNYAISPDKLNPALCTTNLSPLNQSISDCIVSQSGQHILLISGKN